MMNIRKDDMVQVMTGNDKGKVAKVLRILREKNQAYVEGIALVYRHTKPNRQNQQGGRVSKERAVDLSNIALYCNKCSSGVRVGRRFTAKGQKERFCKKCDIGLGTIGPVKSAHAAK
jgi:large subunit ribosomal protein L24